MTITQLLKELDRLPFDGRIRRMVDLGRGASGDPGAARLLEELETGGFYERSLSLYAASGSRDGARVVRAVSDPSRILRGMAVRRVPGICNDAQALASIDALPPRHRRFLLQRLAKAGRRAAVDAFLRRLRAAGDSTFPALLPFGSPALVEEALASVVDRYGVVEWKRLARHHPRVAAPALLREAEQATAHDRRLLWKANAALPLLAKAIPDAALQIARALLRQNSPADLELDALMGRRPAEVVDLILDSGAPVRLWFHGVAARLGVDRILRLYEGQIEAVDPPIRWLGRFTPEDRTRIYDARSAGWRSGSGRLDADLVALLPASIRDGEGRRHLVLSTLAAHPLERLPYAALLPWDEMRAAVDLYLNRPEPEIRAAALSAIASSARFHRDSAS